MNKLQILAQKIMDQFKIIPLGLEKDKFKSFINEYVIICDVANIKKYQNILLGRNYVTYNDAGLLRKILEVSNKHCDTLVKTPAGYSCFSEYRIAKFIELVPTMIHDEVRKLKRLIQFENGIWYNLNGEKLVPKTCEYLYGVKPEVFINMLHPDALVYKIELGIELNNRITHDLDLHLEIRCDKVINAIKHNKELLAEMGIIYK